MPETAEAPKSGGDSSVIHDLLIYCWEYVADTPTYPKINLEAQTGIARSIQGCCMWRMRDCIGLREASFVFSRAALLVLPFVYPQICSHASLYWKRWCWGTGWQSYFNTNRCAVGSHSVHHWVYILTMLVFPWLRTPSALVMVSSWHVWLFHIHKSAIASGKIGGASKSMNLFSKILVFCDHLEAQKGFVEGFSEVADICFISVFGEKDMSQDRWQCGVIFLNSAYFFGGRMFDADGKLKTPLDYSRFMFLRSTCSLCGVTDLLLSSKRCQEPRLCDIVIGDERNEKKILGWGALLIAIHPTNCHHPLSKLTEKRLACFTTKN